MTEVRMKKKSTQATATEISSSFSMTLEMAENSRALLANMMLMVFVLSNTQNKELGLSHLYFLVVLKLASGGK